ncbi:MAG: hypothetical protein ACXVHX_31975 [Solirubrobacteraceae bacterium]
MSEAVSRRHEVANGALAHLPAELPGVGRQDVGPRRPARRGVVGRSALFERLSATAPGGVALVCAPAGSGKSVLVSSWADA